MDEPRSKLARAARARAEKVLSPVYFRHSLRAYGLARAYAERKQVAHDDEGLFVAMMFHDVGLFPPLRDRARPFQVVGADELRAFLEKRRVSPDRVDTLVRAVEYHMQPLPRWSLSNEAGLLHVGAWMDALCVRRWAVGAEAAALERELPRGALIREATGLVLRSIGSPAALLGMIAPGYFGSRKR